MPGDEVAHGVGDGRLQPRGIGRRDRGRLPRDPLDGQRLRRVQRPSRAHADAQHTLARVHGQDAAPERPRLRRHCRRGHVDVQQRAPQLELQVAFQPGDDRQVIHGRVFVEAHADQRLPVIAPQLQPHSGIGARLHEDAAHLLRVVGDAAGLFPLAGHAHEQVRDRPGVRDAGLVAKKIGHAANLAQDDGAVEVGAHVDEEQGAAIHCRVPTRRSRPARCRRRRSPARTGPAAPAGAPAARAPPAPAACA